MTRNERIAATALACLAGAAVATAAARWVMLGSRDVTDRLDHDVIPVTAGRGEFTAVKLTVHNVGVDFHSVVVHFHNGEDQSLELRHHIPAGGETRVIDLAGGRRFISSVEFTYDSSSLVGRHAVVRLYGRR